METFLSWWDARAAAVSGRPRCARYGLGRRSLTGGSHPRPSLAVAWAVFCGERGWGARTAQEAADTFYQERQMAQTTPSVTVNQTVEFNQPVETPAQVARRMEEVNEALARML